MMKRSVVWARNVSGKLTGHVFQGGPGKSRLVQPVPVAPKPDSVTVLKDYDPKSKLLRVFALPLIS